MSVARRAMRNASMLAWLAGLAACHPERILHAPASGEAASLVVAYARAAGVSAVRQAAQADAARVRIIRGSGAVLDTTFAFPASSNELRVRLELQVEQESETVDVIIDLMENGRILESGGDAVSLRQGQATTATIDAVLPLAGILSVGDSHACTIRNGTAYCWGNNTNLAVGDGATTPLQTRPVPVSGGPWTYISAGLTHTCALDQTGHAWCWGANTAGALGDGTTVNRVSPVPAAPGLAFTDISAGAFTTCGLTSNGEVWCWGGQSGSLGNGSTGSSLAPVKANLPAGVIFVTISVGALTACAVSVEHDAYCWGNNASGQVGDGTTVNRANPTPVTGGHKFTSVIVANVNSFLHATCGIETSGAAFCWGFNPSIGGILFPDNCLFSGTSYACSLVPRTVEDEPGRYDIAASGYDHTCGQTRAAKLVCGGFNHLGQLGDGTRTPRFGTFEPAVPAGVGRFGVGNGFSCWLSRSDVYCWGNNGRGQTGTGQDGFEPDPVPIAGVWQEITANSCAASTMGAVSCWGPVIASTEPVPAPSSTVTPIGGPALHDITGSNALACGLDANDAAWCWGSFSFGLGDGVTTTSRAPIRVAGGRTYSAISAGPGHVCAVENGTAAVWCWGTNSTSALGDGTTTNSPVPVQVASSVRFSEIATGSGFTCATTAQAEVYCWGFGRFGQLGFPVAFNPGVQPVPTAVPGLTGIGAITAGSSHACALTSGNVICWGANNFGQVGGSGNSPTGEPPAPVSGIAGITEISAGGSTTCAVASTGQVSCWGQSRREPSSTTVNPTPTTLPGISARDVAVGAVAVCAIDGAGTVSCWGDNNSGAVGAPLPFVLSPTRVVF